MNKVLLFGGLTPAHEILIRGAVEALGYKAEFLPTPDYHSFTVGREYCNRGMCNPAYFTIGNLLKFLMEKRAQGIDVERVYHFVTVGACGPCRFGMYESEYRNALKQVGFGNLEMSLLNQTELTSEGKLRLTPKLIWQLVKAIWIADVIRDVSYQLRPYEVRKGSVDGVVGNYLYILYTLLKEGKSLPTIIKALRTLRWELDTLRFDYSRVKPVVSVIGEFWAHTTESEGNYNIHRWLEEEGAEVKPEPVAGWIDYQLFITAELLKLEIRAKGITAERLKKLVFTELLAKSLRGFYRILRKVFSDRARELPSQKYLAELAKPYYDPLVTGGEGHLEVAKHIYAIKHKKSHMVVSVKPFGCMPSTQSDGAQAKVVADYPESIFVSVETSGDAEVNVKSRIQMKLFEAKRVAMEEFEEVLRYSGITEERFKRACKENPSLQRAFVKINAPFVSTSARVLWANRGIIHGFALSEEVLEGTEG